MGNVILPVIVLLFCGMSLAQRPASPASLRASPSADISGNCLLPVKDASLSRYGAGAQFTAAHYFDNHFGVQLQADYVKANIFDFHDAGIRAGPIFHFVNRSALQPYVHVLVGYSKVKDNANLKFPATYHSSGAILGGVGCDFPLTGNWYGRVGADVQDNWTVRAREGRGLIGVSYWFVR